MSIKVYTNSSLLTQENRRNIFFIFLELSYTNDVWITNYFQRVDTAKQSDYFVWPLCLSYTKEIGKYDDYLAFIEKANQLQKLVWVFTGGDNGWSNFKLPDQGIHFRLAGFKSKYAMPTEILPAFIQDPLKDKQFSILDQSTTPLSIGFVGHADGSFKKWVKELAIHLKKKLTTYRSKPIDSQSFYPSGVKRFQNLKK